MPRKTKVAVVDTSTETPVMETTVESTLPEKFEELIANAEFTVLNSSGGEVRTYSVEVHGPEAEALAKQFATKIGGSIKV